MTRFSWAACAAAFILMSVAITYASGTSATLTWTAPTQDTDGTPVGTIDHYTVSWSRTAGGPVAGTMDVKTLTATVPVSCGSMQFSVTATASGVTSDPAGPVAYATGVVCKPNPPSALAAH
jgi:hypothetical protein